MRNYDKEILKYEVLYRRLDELDDGNDIVETFGTVEEAVKHAEYLLTLGFYTDIRVHQINVIIW